MSSNFYTRLQNLPIILDKLVQDEELTRVNMNVEFHGFTSFEVTAKLKDIPTIKPNGKGVFVDLIVDIDVRSRQLFSTGISSLLLMTLSIEVEQNKQGDFHFLLDCKKLTFLEKKNFRVFGIGIPLQKTLLKQISSRILKLNQELNLVFKEVIDKQAPKFNKQGIVLIDLTDQNFVDMFIQVALRNVIGLIRFEGEYFTKLEAKLSIVAEENILRKNEGHKEVVLLKDVERQPPLSKIHVCVHMNDDRIETAMNEVLKGKLFSIAGFQVSVSILSVAIRHEELELGVHITGDIDFYLDIKTKISTDEQGEIMLRDFSTQLTPGKRSNLIVKMAFSTMRNQINGFILDQIRKSFSDITNSFVQKRFEKEIQSLGMLSSIVHTMYVKKIDIKEEFLRIEIQATTENELILNEESTINYLKNVISDLKSRLMP